MPRATCRCGQTLTIPADSSERVVCPGCGARVRIRLKAAAAPGDGFIRFDCPCGRRLKVDAAAPPPTGQCPGCGRVVPVPAASRAGSRPPGHPEAPTDELPVVDRAALDRWSADHHARAGRPVLAPADPGDRAEVGLRVCPRCGQPVPMGAEVCRACGTPVPRR